MTLLSRVFIAQLPLGRQDNGYSVLVEEAELCQDGAVEVKNEYVTDLWAKHYDLAQELAIERFGKDCFEWRA